MRALRIMRADCPGDSDDYTENTIICCIFNVTFVHTSYDDTSSFTSSLNVVSVLHYELTKPILITHFHF